MDIKKTILRYQEEIRDDPHHRDRSWEHCYSLFLKCHQRNDEQDIDTAALNLAFYLASWGMYRGSSELMQKDYKVHIPVVRKILNEKYADLWQLDFDSITESDLDLGLEIELLFELAGELRRIYGDAGVSATDTLVTKVLLGTLCCTPAYDTNFAQGISCWKKDNPGHKSRVTATFNRKSYPGLVEFYRHNKSEVMAAQDAMTQQQGVLYPVMRLLDMYFWNLGER